MRQNFVAFSMCLMCLTFAGCAASVQSPVTGLVYTNVKGPVTATGNSGGGLRSGSGTVTSIFGLFAFGDASIQTAAQDGGITEIHYVDYESTSILGIFAAYTVTVYGNTAGISRDRTIEQTLSQTSQQTFPQWIAQTIEIDRDGFRKGTGEVASEPLDMLIYVRNEEGVTVDLQTYMENEVRKTLSKIQSIVMDDGLRCDEIKKEIDGFRERLESIIGERQVSLFRSSPSEPPPVSIARNEATALYLKYSNLILEAHQKCIELQTQRSSKHPTEEGNAR